MQDRFLAVGRNMVGRLSFVLFICCSQCVMAQSMLRNVGSDAPAEKQELWAPFAFYSSTVRFAAGVGGGLQGYGQPQLFVAAAAFGSTNGSAGAYGIVRDWRLGQSSRLFADINMFFTRYAESDEYVDGNPGYPGVAGSNQSDPNDFVRAETFSGQFAPTFKYVLPIGSGKDDPIATYTLDRGLLSSGVSGGTSWNPFTSGRSYLEATPFAYWRRLNVINDSETPDHRNYDSFGMRVGYRWDNTDFSLNPTRGNQFSVYVSRDFGVFTSGEAYTTLEADYSQFFYLGAPQGFRQIVLATDFAFIDEISGDAPYYTGATLGGYDRMRAYTFNRFNGRAALYGSAEFRFIPDWNPLKAWSELDRLAQVDWVQFDVFAEGGSVADSVSSELFDEPKFDAGIGIRMLAHHALLRADFAAADEGCNFWVMVGQAF